jgi:hypothetical protein
MTAFRLKINRKRAFFRKRKEILDCEKINELREEELMRSSVSRLEDPIMMSE